MANKREKLFAPLPIESIMAGIFTGSPLGKRLRESGIWVVWDKAVGKNIAAKARPESFRDGVLTVAVSAAPWLQQLNFMKRQIIETLNEHLGAPLVTDIFLKAGGTVKSGKKPTKIRPQPRHLSETDLRKIEQIATEAGDSELQDAFRSLIKKDRSHTPS